MPLVIESALAESFTAKFGASDFAAMLDALSQPPDELCVRVIGATREQRLRNKTAIVEAFGGLDQIVVGSFLDGDARKPANAKGVPLAAALSPFHSHALKVQPAYNSHLPAVLAFEH